MSRTCARCGTAVDPLRDPVRIVDGRIVAVCRACVQPAAQPPPAPPAPEPRVVAPPAPEPPPPVPIVVIAPRRRAVRRPRRFVVAAAAALALGTGLLACLSWSPARLIFEPTVAPPPPADPAPVVAELPPAPEPPPPPVLGPAYVPPDAFVHPLPGPHREMPGNSSRKFGADRPGRRPRECGRGHCGVDLGGRMGTPILAVRDGVVATVHLSARGRGGRYVKLTHADGTASAYMHLDKIRADLRPGMAVQAGEVVGTLGRTGIKKSREHLHFSLTAPNDAGRERHIDPLPLLRKALVIPNAPAVLPELVPAAEPRSRRSSS